MVSDGAEVLHAFYNLVTMGETRRLRVLALWIMGRADITERIWVVEPSVDALNELHLDTAVSQLGIMVTTIGPNFIEGRMPIDHRTVQPFGLMHGGSAALLLETLASAAANHCVDPGTHMCVGLELNCNHVRGAREGHVTGRAEAVHLGRSSMIWSLRAVDDRERLVTIGRLTSAVVATNTGA